MLALFFLSPYLRKGKQEHVIGGLKKIGREVIPLRMGKMTFPFKLRHVSTLVI